LGFQEMVATWLTSGRPRRGATRRRPASIAAAAALALALSAAVAGSAYADVGKKIVERCEAGESISGYTVKQYQRAFHDMTTENIEYGDCAEVIQEAGLAAAGHRGAAGGGQGGGAAGSPGTGTGAAGGALEPTPAQQHILEATRHKHLAPVQLAGGGAVQPGVVNPDLASATSDLPTPVLAVIALVLAGLLLLAGREIKQRLTSDEQS
jgi:hypothetical protein